MASFLSGPTAHLLGLGLQAVCPNTPSGSNCGKILEGIRSFGLPISPKDLFNGGNSCQGGSCGSRSGSNKKNIYENLESHIQGVMQVVKPVMELKGILESGCRSADRGRRMNDSRTSERPMYGFSRQRSYSSTEDRSFNRSEARTPPQRIPSTKKRMEIESQIGRRERPMDSSDEEDKEEQCMYCGRASCAMLNQPCGRAVCTKCDKIEDHELQCKQCKKLSR